MQPRKSATAIWCSHVHLMTKMNFSWTKNALLWMTPHPYNTKDMHRYTTFFIIYPFLPWQTVTDQTLLAARRNSLIDWIMLSDIVAVSSESAKWLKSGAHNILGISLGSFMISKRTLNCSQMVEICNDAMGELVESIWPGQWCNNLQFTTCDWL